MAYRTIRHELSRYSDLATRPEVVALTKCEGVDPEIIAMQRDSILAVNPGAEVLAISSQSGAGVKELLRRLLALKRAAQSARDAAADATSSEDSRVAGDNAAGNHVAPHALESAASDALPVIQLGPDQLSRAWKVEPEGDKFVVTGAKIEKFARRTDLSNYASVNRLRDIMKKMGIRAELTARGATPESIISIAGKEFTLVEDY